MRVTPAVAIVPLLVLLLTWLSLRAFDPEAELFDIALGELDRFAMLESALYRDVFTARAGTLRNYDPLVREINALHDFSRSIARDCRNRWRDDGSPCSACDVRRSARRIGRAIQEQ